MDETYATLVKDYCPPIDEALLSAILSDFELSDETSVSNARETLDLLKASAAEDDTSNFDPSGTSAHFDHANTPERAESLPGTWTSQSEATDVSSLSNGIRSIGLSDTSDESGMGHGHNEELEKLDKATKEALLKEMFPTASDYSVSHTLQKCNGHWNRAMEELLNHMFFEGEEQVDGESRISARGIDAFSEDNTSRRARKGRKQKRSLLSEPEIQRSSSVPSAVSSPAPKSTWDVARKDIEFISTRANVATQPVQSLYHAHNASLAATIAALLELPILPPKLVPELSSAGASQATLLAHADDLATDFPSISHAHIIALIHLTHPSTSSAHELAAALVASPRQSGIQVITHYTPLSTSPSSHPTTHAPHRPTPLPAGLSPAAAHSRYTAQASAAYRRARSDRLMSGAAAYYSQLGRDAAMLRNEATSADADALVASQSRAGVMCDLHGVSVKDAVRIAKREADGWWKGSGGRGVMGLDGRVRGRGDGGVGFTIITGVGRHSEGGKGKLGPAVAKALVAEGWRIVADEGSLVVVGKGR